MERYELKAGVFLPPHHPNNEDVTLCMERDFKFVEWLDELGYAEAWIGEHHCGGMQIYGSPELFIAEAAVRTKRIKLGTGVISLPYHNPLMVADRVIQLDHQTRGRAMFGFGPGFLVGDAMMLGLNPDKQRDYLVEGIDTVIKLIEGEIVSRETDWFKLYNARSHITPYTRPRPHIAVASARTPSGGKIAGRYGLGMICVAADSPDGYNVLDLNWQLANEEAAKHGHVMDRRNLRVTANFLLAETREEARKACEFGIGPWFRYLETLNPAAAVASKSPDNMLDGLTQSRGAGIIGTPDDAVEVLERLWEKTGGFGTVILGSSNWMNFEATKKSFELFMRYVLPKFDGRNKRREASQAWYYENREEFSGKNRGAIKKTIDKHFDAEKAKNLR
ncbi:MAG TPA: LLM class flavin-dependent oxidoreductase [Alphaproteobacteria bacterium]|nr:LLM class flavin-dependent oxidoreductase [Alphaproteobacteria bacterium]